MKKELPHEPQLQRINRLVERLAGEIYRTTEPFPKSETYGLTSQMRRAAVSVASNIAEGQGRLTKGEFQQFLGHSRGSLLELETQLAIALDLHYLEPNELGTSRDQNVRGETIIERADRFLAHQE